MATATKFQAMHSLIRSFLGVLIAALFLMTSTSGAQVDSTEGFPGFDSELLRLKVPEAFARSSLKLEVFADSSWQLYQGHIALEFEASLHMLGLSQHLYAYQSHVLAEAELLKDYRSRRVFAIVSGMGGGTYLAFVWKKGWVYHIPGYAAIAVAGARYLESRRLEKKAHREAYYQKDLFKPSEIQKLVDDYNFRLYQYLTDARIQFREL